MKQAKRTKRQLLESSEQHRQLIKKELSDITSKTNDIAQKAFIGGIVAILGVGLFKLLTNNSDKKAKKKNDRISAISRIGNALIQQASLYILSEGREKIIEYINSLEREHDEK